VYKRIFKRFLDFTLTGIGFLVISPLLLLITLVLFFANGGKPFFYQERPGKDARIFRLYKFKTMNDRRDAEGKLLPDAERMTRAGRLIRSLSLDELPQLWNVLRGDMSLVGPRPLLVRYLPRYNKRQARRHELRPGITGWAQVNGRNAIGWEEKFELDVYYVDHLSLALDLKILWLTLLKVLRREGINTAPGMTMTEFLGSEGK
jgi:lipopolysaccharide/colanic/teichoic acid biosynthesis glycosyltransferase